jgi:ketosteroid isomerase-like protein
MPDDFSRPISQFFQAVVEKRIDKLRTLYAESVSTYLFAEGPRWSIIGIDRIATAWRVFLNGPLAIRSCDWVEGPYSQTSNDMAWLAGILELSVQTRSQLRSVRLRGSFVLRRDEHGDWQIVHHHLSQPAHNPYGMLDASVKL